MFGPHEIFVCRTVDYQKKNKKKLRCIVKTVRKRHKYYCLKLVLERNDYYSNFAKKKK